jgi:ATP-dependent Clp protease protease subunit
MVFDIRTPSQEIKVPDYWNVIFLMGEITEQTAIDVSQRLFSIDLINQNVPKKEPINLIINSGGGDLDAAWQICDIMDSISTPVHTIGLGHIASAALIIFMNGRKGKRNLSSRCSVLSHQYSWGAAGTHSDLLAVRKQQDLNMVKILKHYKETTGMTEKAILKNLLGEHDIWLTPEEAVKFNIADNIIKSKKKPKRIHGRENTTKE